MITLWFPDAPCLGETLVRAGGMYDPKGWANRIVGKRHNRAHCEFSGTADSVSQYAFETTLQCQTTCDGKSNPVETTVIRTFNPEEQGLRPGDGYIAQTFITLSSFGSIFSAWAERECLNQAEKQCLDLSRVKDSRFKSASSGTWSMQETPSCASKGVIYSPYDSRFKLSKKSTLGGLFSSDFPKTSGSVKPARPAPCTTRITGHSCFGDCVLLQNDPGGNIPLTLMTGEPYGTDEKTLCADDLIRSIREKKPSPAAALILCREYFARQLLSSRSDGTTCAAFRADPDCSEFLKALSNQK